MDITERKKYSGAHEYWPKVGSWEAYAVVWYREGLPESIYCVTQYEPSTYLYNSRRKQDFFSFINPVFVNLKKDQAIKDCMNSRIITAALSSGIESNNLFYKMSSLNY